MMRMPNMGLLPLFPLIPLMAKAWIWVLPLPRIVLWTFDVSNDPSLDGSDADSSNLAVTQPLGCSQDEISTIFRAAQSLTSKDRLEVAEERRKNMNLMAYINSLGHSFKDVNDFLENHKKPNLWKPVTCVGEDDPTLALGRVPLARSATYSHSQNPLPAHSRDSVVLPNSPLFDIGCTSGKELEAGDFS